MIGRPRCQLIQEGVYAYGEFFLEREGLDCWRIQCPDSVDRIVVARGDLAYACAVADASRMLEGDLWFDQLAGHSPNVLGGVA